MRSVDILCSSLEIFYENKAFVLLFLNCFIKCLNTTTLFYVIKIFRCLGFSEQLKWIQSKLLRTADDRESTGKLSVISLYGILRDEGQELLK